VLRPCAKRKGRSRGDWRGRRLLVGSVPPDRMMGAKPTLTQPTRDCPAAFACEWRREAPEGGHACSLRGFARKKVGRATPHPTPSWLATVSLAQTEGRNQGRRPERGSYCALGDRKPLRCDRLLIGPIPPLRSGVILVEQRALDPASPDLLPVDQNRMPGEPPSPSGRG
jgi:hypothetical protein